MAIKKLMILEHTNTAGILPEWMDLKALQRYACVSDRTLREWIHLPANPLPAVRVGAKILVRRSAFDRWLEGHKLERIDVSGIVEELASEVMGRA